MAFVLSATLGSTDSNLGEFALGRIAADYTGSAVISGVGRVSAISSMSIVSGVVAIRGVGSLSATGQIPTFVATSILGVSDGNLGEFVLGKFPVAVSSASAQVHGVGSVSTVGTKMKMGVASIVGVGQLSAIALRTGGSTVTIRGVGSVSGIASVTFTSAAATIQGVGRVSSTASALYGSGVATVRGVGRVTGTAQHYINGHALVQGVGTVNAIIGLSSVTITCLQGTATGPRTLTGNYVFND